MARITGEPTYKGEQEARRDILALLRSDHGLALEAYSLKDKPPIRTVTVALTDDGDEECELRSSLSAVLAEHGYTLDAIKVTIAASRDVSGQIPLPLAQPELATAGAR